MAGYTAEKRYAQINQAIQDRVGNVIQTAQFVLKHLDGTEADAAVKGDILGAIGGANPAYSDEDGYVAPFYKHGDYLAEWTAFNDTTQRYIRIPTAFEDFGMVDVTKYDGVDSTGATDSQAGINQAILETAGKFKLFFPPGDYRSDGRINLRPDCHLLGAGYATRIYAGAANTTTLFGHPTVSQPPMTNVTVEDMLIDGNEAERSPTAGSVLRLGYGGVGGNSVLFRNLIFINAHILDANLFLRELTDLSIIGCHILGGGKGGFRLESCSRSLVSGNVLIDTWDDGIALWNVEDVTATGNVCYNTPEWSRYGRAIVVGEDSNRVTVSGNACVGHARGSVGVEGGVHYCAVTGNLLANAGSMGGPEGWGNGVHYQVPGNVPAGEDVNLWVSEHVNITGNVIVNPREHGVFLECYKLSGTQPNLIQNVNVSENVIVSDGVGNAAYKTGLGRGIASTIPNLVTSPHRIKHVRIAGNKIFGFDREGILIDGGVVSNTVEDVSVDNNEILDCGQATESDAIKLNFVRDYRLRNNHAADTQGAGNETMRGIYVANTFGTAMFLGNDTDRCKTYPLSINDADDLELLLIRDNTGFTPWSGIGSIAGAAWTALANGMYKRNTNITFGVRFPPGVIPRVVASSSVEGWFVSATNITETGFTAVTVSTVGNPGPAATGTIYWQAEA